MLKYSELIVALLATLLSFSCKHDRSIELVLDNRVYNLISEYIEKHPFYNTFILEISPSQTYCDSIIESGFLLGPGYKELIKDNNYSVFFDINDKRVYYFSEISSLLKVKRDIWNISNLSDSIVISENDSIIEIIKDAWPLFLKHAVFFNFDANKNIYLNYRPDTLFVPKRLNNTKKFINLK